MIISKTPLRITLGGGGTDLPSYYEKNGGGFLVSAAINKYIYVSVHENFSDNFMLKYSKIEIEKNIEKLKHPLIREALKYVQVQEFLEISSLADIPAGTGLGSSGAFTVGLLKSLYAHERHYKSNIEIAEDACNLEINILNEPVGKQDQYISAVGGLTALSFDGNGKVEPSSVRINPTYLSELEDSLLLFYTGIQRSASEELSALYSEGNLKNVSIKENLDDVKKIGYKSCALLESGDLEGFAKSLTYQWELKLSRSPSPIHNRVNYWIQTGLENGALGGKLVGAGGGGFLLFFSNNRQQLKNSMSNFGLREVPIRFDYNGAVIV